MANDLQIQLRELTRAIHAARAAPLHERLGLADYSLGLSVELLGELVARVIVIEERIQELGRAHGERGK
jgi:hypothetical protein